MNKNFSEMNLEELKEHRSQLLAKLESKENLTNQDLDTIESEHKQTELRIKDILDQAEDIRKLEERIANDDTLEVMNSIEFTQIRKETNPMNQELRSLQKFITQERMTEQETRALNFQGSAAVVPTTIENTLITSDKYSDLLHRASIFTDGNAGLLRVPVASSTGATWKTELEEVDEASPALTYIELNGYELMRLMTVSERAVGMSTGGFEDLMLRLLSSEMIESLEESFIKGTGVGQPTGLRSLTFDTTNSVSATDEILASDLAKGISLLPQKYARNAIILANNETLYSISQFKGTNEYAFNLVEGTDQFLKKEIVPNEHLSENEIYIVDPKQLYVRFASPIQVEPNKSSGFRSASIDLRGLAVVDAKWNPKAVVKVSVA